MRIKGPEQHHPLVIPLTIEEPCFARDLHRADASLHHRRDKSIIRLMLETGIRSGELITLGTDDVEVVSGLVTV